MPYLSAFAVMIHYEEALYIKCMQLHLYPLPSGEGKASRGTVHHAAIPGVGSGVQKVFEILQPTAIPHDLQQSNLAD